jgi:hypothetical protein
MSAESTHAIQYHLSRIAQQSANQASASAKELPSSETSMRHYLSDGISIRGTDEEIARELRFVMETSMRVLLMMQRRTGNFSL